MKQKSFNISHQQLLIISLLFLFLVISSSLPVPATAFRPLKPKLGEDIMVSTNINGFTQTGPMLEMLQKDSWNLMGVEEYCGNGDEECLKRRMISEAHLDYIYTQHHKP